MFLALLVPVDFPFQEGSRTCRKFGDLELKLFFTKVFDVSDGLAIVFIADDLSQRQFPELQARDQ